MRIYFAGKISRNGWRNLICGDACEVTYSELIRLFDPNFVQHFSHGSGRHKYFYGGPFFVACDHGCSHGPAQHGVGLQDSTNPCKSDLESSIPRESDRPTFCNGGDTIESLVNSGHPVTHKIRDVDRSCIFRLNNERVLRSDWLFAYIEDLTAFGTFFEIGYAFAHDIPIALGFPKSLRQEVQQEMWYFTLAADHVYFGSATETFNKFDLNTKSYPKNSARFGTAQKISRSLLDMENT